MIKIGQMNHWILLSIDLEESIGLLVSMYTFKLQTYKAEWERDNPGYLWKLFSQPDLQACMRVD